MELNEKEYLAQTVAILDKKIKDSNAKYKKSREKLRSNIQNQGNNFSDLERGGDLSNSYSTLGLLQEEQERFELENKRLKLQHSNPYFARIDFTPQGKKKAQNIYIGIGNVLDNNRIYVADWRAPISSMYYDYSLGDASFKIDNDIYKGKINLKRQ